MATQKKRIEAAKKLRVIVYRSNKYISAAFVDDEKNTTLFSKSTKKVETGKTKSEKAKALGLELGKIAKDKKVKEIVFDRNKYLYHGQIKSLAEGLRESGLVF